MRTCRNCGEKFETPRRRGRPPISCEACRAEKPKARTEGAKQTRSRKRVLIENPSLEQLDEGDKVTVMPREWSGVLLSEFNGRFIGTGEDAKGVFYKISTKTKKVNFRNHDLEDFSVRYVRPENVILTYKEHRRIHV